MKRLPPGGRFIMGASVCTDAPATGPVPANNF